MSLPLGSNDCFLRGLSEISSKLSGAEHASDSIAIPFLWQHLQFAGKSTLRLCCHDFQPFFNLFLPVSLLCKKEQLDTGFLG